MQTEVTTRGGVPRDRKTNGGALRAPRHELQPQRPPRVTRGVARRASGLGWFSIGLGLAELLAPRGLARMIGVRDDERTCNTMRALGLREIAGGVGILMRPEPSPWVWARFAGDVMDLALLGDSFIRKADDRSRLGTATAAVAAVTLLDAVTARQLGRDGPDGSERGAERAIARADARRGVFVAHSITVNRPREEVYRFWHDFQNLPRFMAHLESVDVHGRQSHWCAKAPAGMSVEWDAEMIEDVPNERIAWRSLEGAEIPNEGSVQFFDAPGGRGTEIVVELRYRPPGGRLAATFAKLFGEEPNQQIRGDLRRFKQVMELGEVVHSDASIHRGMHPAQPSSDDFDRKRVMR
jgi:uncharacterized membrane protein